MRIPERFKQLAPGRVLKRKPRATSRVYHDVVSMARLETEKKETDGSVLFEGTAFSWFKGKPRGNPKFFLGGRFTLN